MPYPTSNLDYGNGVGGATHPLIDANDFANDPAFTGQYAPLADTGSIFLPAAQWVSTAGSPTLQGNNAQGPNWLLDADATESIGVVAPPFPSSWNTFRADIFWSNAGAGSGDVRLLWNDGGADIGFADGDTIAYAFEQVSVITAPALNVLKVSTLLTSSTVAATEHPLNIFRIDRQGANAADTLTNDMRFYGANLVRLT